MQAPFIASPSALATLDRDVREGIRVLPKRGLEIGGLLIGKLIPVIDIHSVRSVEIEHQFGPSFVLSEADVERFKQAIRELPPGSEIIGHFRSQTKGSPGIREDDDKIAGLFTISDPILIIVPASGGAPEPARLYRRHHRTWIDASQADPKIDDEAPQLPPQTAVTINPAPRRALSNRWIAIPAVCMIIGASIYWYAGWRRPVSPPASPPAAAARIGLTVERSAGTLLIRWDGASPALAQAVSGVLIIKDGQTPLEVALNPEQLRGGRVFYTPQSPNLDLRLQINYDRDRYIAEGLKVDTGLPAVQPHPASIPAPPSVQVTMRVEPRRFSLPPPVAVAKAPVHDLPAPPPVVLTPPTVSPILEIPMQPGPRLPIPGARPSDPVTYLAATPLRRVGASVPPHLRSAIRESTSVAVKVSIDASGRVINAVPVDAGGFQERLLAPQASQAARLWTFSPARLNGRPQSSELVLTFTFQRDGGQSTSARLP